MGKVKNYYYETHHMDVDVDENGPFIVKGDRIRRNVIPSFIGEGSYLIDILENKNIKKDK